MTPRKRKLLAAGGALVLVSLLAFAGVRWQSAVQWRVEFLSSKLTGSLPNIGWSELGYMILPDGLRTRLYAGNPWVKEKDRGEGPCPVLWDTPLGQFWGRADNDKDLVYVLRMRVQDAIYLRGPLAIRFGDVVLDGGSHLGTFTRFALQQGAQRVVAFDPDSTNNICFKRTFRKEIAEGRVVLVEEALWDKPGVVQFAEDPSGLGSAVKQTSPDTRDQTYMKQAPATTIDESVQRLHLDQVSFIKMHVEGAERQALQGARQTIARFHPRLMVAIHHHGDDPVAVPQDIAGLSPDYRVAKHYPQVYGY